MKLINKNSLEYKTIQILANINELIRFRFMRKKMWLSLGDSLTKTGMYQTIVNKNFKMKIINNSVGGSTLADNGSLNCMCKRFLLNMPTDVEFITIMCGTNDFSQNIKIGTLNSRDKTTFYGALKFVIKTLKKKYPLAKIVLLSPPKRLYKNKQATNLNGNCIKDFSSAMEKTSGLFGIYFVDICNKSGIEIENLSLYTLDGVHLNIKGYSIVSSLMTNELISKKVKLI